MDCATRDDAITQGLRPCLMHMHGVFLLVLTARFETPQTAKSINI